MVATQQWKCAQNIILFALIYSHIYHIIRYTIRHHRHRHFKFYFPAFFRETQLFERKKNTNFCYLFVSIKTPCKSKIQKKFQENKTRKTFALFTFISVHIILIVCINWLDNYEIYYIMIATARCIFIIFYFLIYLFFFCKENFIFIMQSQTMYIVPSSFS